MGFFTSDKTRPRNKSHRRTYQADARNIGGGSAVQTSAPDNLHDLRKARIDYLSKTPEERRKTATARAAPAGKSGVKETSSDAERRRQRKSNSHAPSRVKAREEPRRPNHRKAVGNVYVYGAPSMSAGGESAAARFHGSLDTAEEHGTGHSKREKNYVVVNGDRYGKSGRHRRTRTNGTFAESGQGLATNRHSNHAREEPSLRRPSVSR